MPESSSLDTAELKAIAAKGYRDPVFFCRFFLHHLFPKPIPWFHRGILSVLTRRTDFLLEYGDVEKLVQNFTFEDAEGHARPIFEMAGTSLRLRLGRYTLLMIPRGFGKTTIAGIAVPLRDILYGEVPFGVYVSETGPHSKMQLNNVKRELESNSRIRAVFGELKPSMTAPEKWSEEFFETTTGMAMAARGRGGQIRGLNHRGQRPKKILVDDVEDKESVATDVQRLIVREWAYGDLMPALPELDPDSTITALGTLLHPEALLQIWAQDPQWTVIKFGARDASGALLWPENMDEHKLAIKKQSYALAGQLHVFYMEYFNQSRAAETAKFKPEFFIYGLPSSDDEPLQHAIYVDPAISESVTADETCIYVVGMSKKGRIFVRECWSKVGAPPRELIDQYFALAKQYNCIRHGVESIQYQAALVHLMREEMFRKKHYFEIEPIKHASRKEERILGILQPRYANGYVIHCRRFAKLETQLLDFGQSGTHDDHPDALAGAIALLDPYAAAAAGDLDLGEDQYPELDEELEGEFGTAP